MAISIRFACASVATLALASLASASIVTEYTMRNDLPGLISEVRDFGVFANRASLRGELSGDRPTATSIMQGWRVFGQGMETPIVVKFQNEVSSIRVFNNIDNPTYGWDHYQYSIYGSRDGVSYEQLFDATAAEWTGREWRLGGWTGAAPTRVNTVVHSSINPGGATGYVTDFAFTQKYFYFKFGASSLAMLGGNVEQQLSGVGYLSIPAPSCGLAVLLSAMLRQRRRA